MKQKEKMVISVSATSSSSEGELPYLSLFTCSTIPSSFPQHNSNNTLKFNNPISQDPIFTVTRFSISSPPSKKSSSSSSSVTKKRHWNWKQGEFSGVSETSLPGITRRNPIKNIKKLLGMENYAKACVNTVTEVLSDSIDKKQWSSKSLM